MSKSSVVTLIFDGDCGFCTTAANYVVAHSKVSIIAVPWQRCNLTAFNLTEFLASKKVYLAVSAIQEDSAKAKTVIVYAGHKAFAQLLILQPLAPIRAIGRLILVPPFAWFAAVAYALIAKYRHKLPGGTPACRLP